AEEPIGFAKYACRQDINPEGPTGTLLHKLYLLPDATGHRYGEQIFRAVEKRAKETGESWLWLEVLAANTGARRFYERQGMQHVKDVAF
ncbi:GNAT family N-acetyltransferase, partial [Klebsiella pneumoniae]